MLKIRIMLAVSLSAFAIGMANSSSASASAYTIWGAEWCMPTAIGKGGFTANCWVPFNGGNYARAISWPTFLTFACLWLGYGAGMFADPGCVYLGPGYGYEVWFDPPALSVAVNGGAYKLKSSIGGVKVTIACTAMQAKEPDLESGGVRDGDGPGMIAAAALEYTGCKVEEPSKCEVGTPEKPAGTISTKAVLGDFVENTGRTKVETLIKPQKGNVFAEFEFKGECSLKSTKASIEGSTLTDGGAEDEISNELKVEPLSGDSDLLEKAVEKYLLLSEPSSKKYLNDQTEETAEAKLTVAGQALTITGEASLSGEFSGATFKDEAGEEVTIEKNTPELGLDRL